MTRQEFKRHFPPRKPASHKGDFGRVCVLAGARGYTGAPFLVSAAALRSGAGLITLAVPRGVYPVVARRLAEVMVRPLAETRSGSVSLRAENEIRRFLKTQDVLAMGPGLSRNAETQRLIRRLAISVDLPLVLDADGINAFQGEEKLLSKLGPKAVLTPHPGEAGRVAHSRVPRDERGRKQFTRDFARRYGFVMVLKGHHTVVASPRGEVYVNRTGNPGLATGGSGDLLTGIIAAFIGQGLGPFAAAKCGVFIHGYAADLAVKRLGEVSLAPMDVLAYMPAAFKKLLGR